MRKIAETTNYGLYLNDDDTETFLSWRNKLNGNTGTSNMDLIDTALNDNATSIKSIKSDLSEHIDDTTLHLTESEHTALTEHIEDSDIHVTEDDKATWSSGVFAWNMAYDTKSMESWNRSSTTYVTLEEDDCEFNVATFASTSSTAHYICGGFIPYEDIAGQEVTISFYARSDDADNIVANSGGVRVILQINESDTISTTLATETYSLISQGITTEWVKYSYTFTYSSSAATDTAEVNFRINNYSLYTMQVKMVKVEYGDTATEWTPHITEYNDGGDASTADTLNTARYITVDLDGEIAEAFDGSADVTIGFDGILPISNGGTGNSTGLAATATALASSRTVRVNLASTDAASFDGTANITPGISGILPYDHGGTGASSYRDALYNLIYNPDEITTPIDTDYIGMLDSTNEIGGKLSFASLKTYLESELDINAAIDLTGTSTTLDGILPITYGGTGNSEGKAVSAETADALTTARSIQVDLTSTSAASFDGSSDITPGVTGALPLTRGGTGQTTGPLGLYALINACSTLTSSTVTTSDYFALQDYDANTGKRITLGNLVSYLESNLSIGSDYEIVVGTYDGEVSSTSSSYQTITLGGEPEFVMVVSNNGPSIQRTYWWYDAGSSRSYSYGAFATPDSSAVSYNDVDILWTVSTGFCVCNDACDDIYYLLNRSSYTYIYLAIL